MMRYLVAATAAVSTATLVAAQAGFSSLPYSFITPYNHSCAYKPAGRSCPEANPMQVDSCCQETFGGLILSTQFWSTYTGLESSGQLLPPNTWSLHGLWPDFCNGSYTGYCDVSRQFDPVPSPNVSSTGVLLSNYTGNVTGTNVLTQYGQLGLLAYMNKYWINQGASNDAFWMHEFSKHATCFSNYQTQCSGPTYQPHQEVAEFLGTAVAAYQKFPTYTWLKAANITPSNTTRYSLRDIQAALYKGSGAMPYVACAGDRYNATAAGNGTTDNGRIYLSETWYYNYAYGPISNLNFTAVNNTVPSSCASSTGAVYYPLRANGSEWTA